MGILNAMCGRFVLTASTDDLLAEFDAQQVIGDDLPPSWNVAPTDPVRIVTERAASVASASGVGDGGDVVSLPGPTRQLRTVRWGLVPSWAKDAAAAARMINARSETVGVKPSFKAAAARRRCLVPADGYYEWAVSGGRKTPYFLHGVDGELLAMAGLYEIWRDPTVPDDDPARLLWTCTVITRPAPDALGHIHDRSPVVVPHHLRDAWLDCDGSGADFGSGAAEAEALLAAMPPPRLVPREVGAAVGNIRNNSPSLIAPARGDDAASGPEPAGLF